MTELLNSVIGDPITLSDPLNSDDAPEWKRAMELEYNSIVDRSKSKNIIGSKWVFAIKCKPDDFFERYKARLVAQGCSQKFNIDYHETFVSVVRHSTVRIILALAVRYELLLRHVDIMAAYLNGELEDEVFMEQLPMFKC